MDDQRYPMASLEVGVPGQLIKSLAHFSPGVREVSDQIPIYTAWWDQQNRTDYFLDGPLLAVIGDSSALGIGASHPSNGYVSLIREHLTERDAHRWRVINLAKSGAKLDDALSRQLPELRKLETVDVVICCVGSNDIFWSLSVVALQRNLKKLVTELPSPSFIGALAGGSPRAKASNVVLRKAAAERSIDFVEPWGVPGTAGATRLASDKFHPNDLGYKLVASAFIDAMG